MGDSLARAFWRFSLRLYRRPAVAEACLRLQDRHRLDVNLLLFLCFAARRGYGGLSARQVSGAAKVVAAWTAHVILPLRTARCSLAAPWPMPVAASARQLRPKVARLELSAERSAQFTLGYWLAAQTPGRRSLGGVDGARRNLEIYACRAVPPIDRPGLRDLQQLISATFAD